MGLTFKKSYMNYSKQPINNVRAKGCGCGCHMK